MNKQDDIFRKAYLESFIINEDTKDVTSPEPKKVPNTGNAPIDDLTKENTTTIEEDSSEEVKPESKELNVEIQNEAEEDNEESEFEEGEDGWPEEMSENLSYVLETLENFVYEIRNCTRGAYTNCKTKEELKAYMTNDLVDMLTSAAEEF